MLKDGEKMVGRIWAKEHEKEGINVEGEEEVVGEGEVGGEEAGERWREEV